MLHIVNSMGIFYLSQVQLVLKPEKRDSPGHGYNAAGTSGSICMYKVLWCGEHRKSQALLFCQETNWHWNSTTYKNNTMGSSRNPMIFSLATCNCNQMAHQFIFLTCPVLQFPLISHWSLQHYCPQVPELLVSTFSTLYVFCINEEFYITEMEFNLCTVVIHNFVE